MMALGKYKCEFSKRVKQPIDTNSCRGTIPKSMMNWWVVWYLWFVPILDFDWKNYFKLFCCSHSIWYSFSLPRHFYIGYVFPSHLLIIVFATYSLLMIIWKTYQSGIKHREIRQTIHISQSQYNIIKLFLKSHIIYRSLYHDLTNLQYSAQWSHQFNL